MMKDNYKIYVHIYGKQRSEEIREKIRKNHKDGKQKTAGGFIWEYDKN